MNINTIEALTIAAHSLFPNEGAWLVNASKREAFILNALLQGVETWHDTVRARWLSAVMADTYGWRRPADALFIVRKYPDDESWHAEHTPAKWWDELRFYEEGRLRDQEMEEGADQ